MSLPTLAAVMMLRNEEHNIDRCLSSIRNLVDDIIVVDTGSIDRTVKKCREYGSIVYPSLMNWKKPPIFDFSCARNEGLNYAQDLNFDWICIIDADEELQDIGITPDQFKQRLSQTLPQVHALGCQVHERKNDEFIISWWGTRFFKVKKGVFYDGICHNRPKLINGYAAGTNIVLYHYGYSDLSIMDSKRHRTLTLLNKRIDADPDDYGAWYYKALTLFGMDQYDDAIDTGIHAIELIGSKIDYDYNRLNYFGALYYAIGWGYFRKWQLTQNQEFATKAYQWWITGYDKWPEDIDLNFWLCNIGYLGNSSEMVQLHGNSYLKSIEKYTVETALPMDKFVNSYNMNDMAIGPRHIHTASKKHEQAVRSMIHDMERKAA